VSDTETGRVVPTALIEQPPALTPVLELGVDCDLPIEVGKVPGGVRRIVPITGGWFRGLGDREIGGEVLPGGADWNLQRDDGVFEVYARYLLRTDDGALLTIVNEGLARIRSSGLVFRTVARFDVAEERHRWLARSVLVGHVEPRNPFTGVDIRLHRVD
jgi:hypothetical protein